MVIASYKLKDVNWSKCFKKIKYEAFKRRKKYIQNTCFAYDNSKFFDQNFQQIFLEIGKINPLIFMIDVSQIPFNSIGFRWIIISLLVLSCFLVSFCTKYKKPLRKNLCKNHTPCTVETFHISSFLQVWYHHHQDPKLVKAFFMIFSLDN